MKKITVKIPAKINLTLDIKGVKEGYHDISSLVTSIDLFDTVTASKRKDKKITLKMQGLPVDCSVTENNAYKAAVEFYKTFGLGGVDIVVNKQIPVAGGLGGSSADIAGVLKALNSLFELNQDMSSIASSLGSDAPYMLQGGYAVIEGRGEKVIKQDLSTTLYYLIITEEKQISARSCYKEFDKKGKIHPECTIEAVKMLKENDMNGFFNLVKNDLGDCACEILSDVQFNLTAMEKAGADKSLVAGSGPSVVGIFSSQEKRERAYRKLLPLLGAKLIKAQTFNV